MDTNSSSKIPSQIILGLAAIGLGLLFLLANLGIVDAHWIRQLWPLVFVLIGVLKILHAKSKAGRGYFVGGVLILVGSVMTLHRLGLVYFSWHTWWPILLILLGFSIIFKRGFRHRRLASVALPDGEKDASLDAVAVLGGCRRQVRSQNFRGGEITAIMGGCKIDLRDASISGVAVLNVFAMWGGIELKVPTDWTVVLQGTGILGGFDEKTATPVDASKRLIIRGYAIMGGLDVKN